jgi:hypothetical protein
MSVKIPHRYQHKIAIVFFSMIKQVRNPFLNEEKMGILIQTKGRFPVGIWFVLFTKILILLAWLMQAYSLFDWEAAIMLGIQNDSFSGGDIEKTLANVEHSVALADMVWALPISIVAFFGLWQKQFYGFMAVTMEFAICVYFPLVFSFQRWHTLPETAMAAILLWAIPSLLGIICLWLNRDHFK